MDQKTIFIVEDEDDIVTLLTYNLKQEGYNIEHCVSGSDALVQIPEVKPDLVLLDLMIPEIDGFEVCKQLKAKKETKDIPIIMVSAKSQEHTIVAGLELGADDYITKPFSLGILIARVRNVLRRQKQLSRPDSQDVLIVNTIEINRKQHSVDIEGTRIDLNATEFKLLDYMAEHVDWVFTRNQLLDAVKGDDVYVTDRSIDVLMVALRKKLGPASKLIDTIRGVGYRLKST